MPLASRVTTAPVVRLKVVVLGKAKAEPKRAKRANEIWKTMEELARDPNCACFAWR